MKKYYSTPEIDFNEIDETDVVCASGYEGDGEGTVYWSSDWYISP